MSTGPVPDELYEQLKEVSVKIDDSSTLLVASRSRKKKNKNKTDANTPMAMMLPPDIPESSVSAGEQGSVSVLSSNTFPSAIAAQINTLQDSFNQVRLCSDSCDSCIVYAIFLTFVAHWAICLVEENIFLLARACKIYLYIFS